MVAVRSVKSRPAVLIVSALVVSGLAVPAVTAPAAAAPPPANCVAEQPTEADAVRIAGACRRRVENLAERTEYAQVFVNPDGSRTLEETVEPARVRVGKNWVPVDTRLRATSAGIEPTATVLPMTFSAGGNALVGRLRDRDRELSVTWPEKLPKPAISGSTALFSCTTDSTCPNGRSPNWKG